MGGKNSHRSSQDAHFFTALVIYVHVYLHIHLLVYDNVYISLCGHP